MKDANKLDVFGLIESDRAKANINYLKSYFIAIIITIVRENSWSQSKAAKKAHISAPRMNNLFQGQASKFSVDSLMEILINIGYDMKVSIDLEENGLNSPISIDFESRKNPKKKLLNS